MVKFKFELSQEATIYNVNNVRILQYYGRIVMHGTALKYASVFRDPMILESLFLLKPNLAVE